MKTLFEPLQPILYPLSVLLLGITLCTTASAAPLAVQLTGGFNNQSYTIDYGDGTYDEINVSATVNVTFNPSQPTCDNMNFTSSSAQLTGTVHVWGTASHYDPYPSTTINFDDTWNYNYGTAVPVPVSYEGQTGSGGVLDLNWQITTSVDPNRATPYALHFYGGPGVLRLWVALPYPFWYPVDWEYYDSAGSAVVSGQESVNSCLNGTVRAADTGEPVAGAHVRFGNVPQTTDSSGSFFYGNIPANTYQLIITNSGYFPYSNILTIRAFTIVQDPVVVSAVRLKVFDANPYFLGSVFYAGIRFPLDANDPRTPAAREALAQANTMRRGLVADGCTILLLRFEADEPGVVTFTQTNPLSGTLTGIDGPLPPGSIATAPLGGKHMAFALFTAPDQVTANTVANLIQASFAPTGGTDPPLQASAPITIRHAPVLLVHGLWGKPADWNVLYQQLNESRFDASRANYRWCRGAAGAFADYRGFIRNEARYLVDIVRLQDFAATRVDVVAHSMGGILTRLDANDPNVKTLDNNYQGYFRRLITVDTPHFGSRAATVLLELVDHFPIRLKGLFWAAQCPVDKGGVADLDPRTFAASVRTYGTDALIGATELPVFPIACTVGAQGDLPLGAEFLVYALIKQYALALDPSDQQNLLCGQTVSFFDPEILLATKVFSAPSVVPHDGIVPLVSQQGACSRLSIFTGVAHTAAPANDSVDQLIVLLLKTNNTPFDLNGFPAVTQASLQSQLCGPGLTGVGSETLTPLMQLTLTPSLLVVRPGDLVSFYVQALPGAAIDNVIFFATQNDVTIASAESTNLPIQFSFTIPTNVLGAIDITVFAVNAQGQTDLAQTNLVVLPGPGIDIRSLAVVPSSFTFSSIGQVGELAVSGVFSDGSSFDISSAGSGTTYSSSAPSVATVESNGVVTATGQGTATVNINCEVVLTNIPVNVSLQQPVILSTMPVSAAPGTAAVPFTLVGSSLGGATKVEFFRNSLPDSTVSATNLSIGAAGLNVTGLLSVSSNALPGLRTVAVTTPAGRSSVTSSQGNRFFVGTAIQIGEFQLLRTATNAPQIHLHIVGTPAGVCVLQSTTNLTTWSAVATNNLLGGDWFLDRFVPTGQNALFYRAALVPSN